VYGRHHCAFSDEEELELAAMIVDQYIIPGMQFIGLTFRELALTVYSSTERDPAVFKCSRSFIRDFERPHGFSSWRFCVRRRQQDFGSYDIAEWIKHVTTSLLENPLERVINCDETMWCVLPNGLLTWASVGGDGVSVHVNTREKESITALACITAAHDRLPLFLLAKGKTPRVEQSQLGAPGDRILAHSHPGWTTVLTFHKYFATLRDNHQD
jgi:hypothetical protein